MLLTTLTSGRYDYSAVLRTIQSQAPSLEKVILLPDISGNRVDFTMSLFFTTYSALLILGKRHQPDWQSLDASVVSSDILNLQFTSGSTGLPKAAALTHSGMINSSQYIGLNMALKPTDSIVIPLPLFHAFGLVIGLTTAWVAGGSAVLPSEYFDAAATLAAVQRYSATGLYGVTTMFIDMLSHPSFAGTNRSTLRFGVMAGSAMPADLTTRIHTRFPIPRLYTNWGMTELSSIATMVTHRDPDHKRLHTAGRLLPNFTMKIVEPNSGSCLPWGARGEIVVAGFGVMAGYFNEPERTASTLKQHSEDLEAGGAGVDPCTGKVRTWMHTGDEGYIDPEGYLVVTGRIKDLIIRGGENIAPLEIEERLFLHPAIKQAAAFGIPSQRYGEEVACLLELDETTTSWDARPSDDEVRRWVRKTLSRFKAPVRIWWLGDKAKGVVAEWPKTANGKLRKKDIREVGEGELMVLLALDGFITPSLHVFNPTVHYADCFHTELLKKEQAQEAMVDSPSKIRPSL